MCLGKMMDNVRERKGQAEKLENGSLVSKSFRIDKKSTLYSEINNAEFIYCSRQRKVYHHGWLHSWPYRQVKMHLERGDLFLVCKVKKYSFLREEIIEKGSDADYMILGDKQLVNYNNKNLLIYFLESELVDDYVISDFRINGRFFPTQTKLDIEVLIDHIKKQRK